MRQPDDPDAYACLHRDVRWQVPADFSIAVACSARRARSRRTAIRWETQSGAQGALSYRELDAQSRRLAAALRRLGVQPVDRVAVVMPQRPEVAVAHMAVYSLGAVAMPLSVLFGPDALEYRLQDSGACVAIVDEGAIANLQGVRAACPALRSVIAVDGEHGQGQGDIDWTAALAGESGRFTARSTHADDAAVLIYTSGTTGPPKGALIPHRALIGNLSGFVCSQNRFGAGRGDRPLSLSVSLPVSLPVSLGKGERATGSGGVSVRPQGSRTRAACSGAPPTGPGPAG